MVGKAFGVGSGCIQAFELYAMEKTKMIAYSKTKKLIPNWVLFVLFGLVFIFLSCKKNTIGEELDQTEWNYIDSLLNVAESYRKVSIDSMLLLSKDATELAEGYNYNTGYIQGLLQQGIAHFYKGEDSIALSKLKIIEESELRKNENSALIVAKKNSLRGGIYQNLHLYDSAAFYMFEALQVFEKQQNTLQVALVSANIASNYILTDAYDKALDFTKKAELNFQKENHKEGLIAVYQRMGSIYSHQEQYDSALFYFHKSLKLAKEVNHIYFIANGNRNVGSIYTKTGQFEIGETYLQKAVTLYQEQENLLGYAMTVSLLAQMNFNQKEYEAALFKYEEVNKIASENHYLSLLKESHEELSKSYENQNSFELALQHNQQAQIINDSLNKTEHLRTINKLENKYLNAQTDKIILEQKIDIQKERNRRLILSLVSIVIIAISFFVIWRRKSENRLLAEKNELIENQQRELKHRTGNQLEQLSDLFTIYGLMNNDNTKVLKEAQSRIEAINLIYKYLENSEGNSIDVPSFIEKLVNNVLVVYGVRKEEIDVEIDILNIKMDANKVQAVGQIVNEILNNTFKHAFGTRDEKRKIVVRLSKKNADFELIIGDNGKGFDSQKQEADRMGLLLITAFVKSIRGEMVTETGGGGTRYEITFS